jgi:hypothetical protein
MDFICESFKVGATLAAQRIVAISAADTVGYPAAATTQPIGVTRDTVKDTNQAIPVQVIGRAKVFFNDTCAAGGLVAADASGRAVPHVDTTAGSYVIGRLVGPAVSATGTIGEILVMPFFKSIP